MAKRGRTPQPTYVTSWDEAVPGIRQVVKERDSRDKPTIWYLYPTGRSEPYFGTVHAGNSLTERRAIAKFRRWQASKDGALWEKQHENEIAAEANWQSLLYAKSQQTQADRAKQLVDKWNRQLKDDLRNLILTDPKRAAVELDIEQLAYIDQLAPPPPSIPLQEVGELYKNRRKAMSLDWKRRSMTLWDEFVRCVAVRTVREITADCIAKYHDMVYDEFNKGKSSVYVFHRFTVIKTVLRYALMRGKDQEQLQRVLTLCKMLVPPPKPSVDPQPIEVGDFQVLLAQAKNEPLWTAVLLLSLNAALYPSEVAAVNKKDIDLEAGTLVMDRGKTGVPRIAILWPRTIGAIRVYQQAKPHQAEAVFISRTGRRYDADRIARNIRRFRRAAKLSETLTFDQIRDGALTAAFNADGVEEKHAKLLGGHRCGMSDHYVKRNPRIVSRACQAIEEHYFPT